METMQLFLYSIHTFNSISPKKKSVINSMEPCDCLIENCSMCIIIQVSYSNKLPILLQNYFNPFFAHCTCILFLNEKSAAESQLNRTVKRKRKSRDRK